MAEMALAVETKIEINSITGDRSARGTADAVRTVTLQSPVIRSANTRKINSPSIHKRLKAKRITETSKM